jgi:hypothetical protein
VDLARPLGDQLRQWRLEDWDQPASTGWRPWSTCLLPGAAARPGALDEARLVLLGGTFGGPVQITVVTAGRGPEQRTLPDVQVAASTGGTEKPRGPVLELTLPARSFALVEGPVSP